MGNEQPKKLVRASKIQIEVAAMKSKYHLELMKDRKNAEIIKTEKQLVARIKAPTRNKMEEVLMAERIVNALKYAQACNYLMSYCATLKPQANFISQNMFNPQKIMPYLSMIYSLIYAAQTLGLSSLKEFRDLMKALNDPQAVTTLVDPEIKTLLEPQPSSAEINQYFIEMSERNQIPLETINVIGHKYSKNINQKPSNEPTFSQIEKMLADQLQKGMGQGSQGGQNGQGGNMGGQGGQFGLGGQGGFGNQGGYGQGGFGDQGFGGQGFNNQGGFGGQGNQYGPNGQGWSGQSINPYSKPNQDVNPYEVPNYGPSIHTPGKVEPSKNLPPPSEFHQTESKMSIKDVNDVPFYPEVIKPEPVIRVDPDFNALCEKIRTGL